LNVKNIEGFDIFDTEVVFWVEMSDVPSHIQAAALKIDGDAYNKDCFGMCIYFNQETREYAIMTDTDCFNGNQGNLYYVDDNGDKHWFLAEIGELLEKQLFSACDRIRDGIDAPNGYKVEKTIQFADGYGFLLTEKKDGLQPFATHMFAEHPPCMREYEWSHYHKDRAAAEQDFEKAVSAHERSHCTHRVIDTTQGRKAEKPSVLQALKNKTTQIIRGRSHIQTKGKDKEAR